jgi:hypothetical protein
MTIRFVIVSGPMAIGLATTHPSFEDLTPINLRFEAVSCARFATNTEQ